MDKIAQAPIPINNIGGVATLRGLEGVFANLIRVALGFAGIALFLMLIVGGFQYITSGGDPKKADSARRTLTYAILGLILIASVYLILRFIAAFTGANILNFQVTIY